MTQTSKKKHVWSQIWDSLSSSERDGWQQSKALFSSQKWNVFDTVAFSFVCDKYYLIMD